MFVMTAVLWAAGCSKAGREETGGLRNQEENSFSETEPETVTITSLNGSKEEILLEVPYDPKRIAVLDMASLDILNCLGAGDRIVGMASTSLDYLQDYAEKEEIAALGTIKEADMEAVMACEPEVILIGGRLASVYDELSQIAPVIYLAVDTEIGVVESVRNNAAAIASLFGKEEEVEDLMEGFDQRIQTLAEFASGKTAIVGMCTSGSFNILGKDGRCSIISNEIGFDNVGIDSETDTSTHGNEASFEFVVEKNPEYMFVLDRDAAIHREGAELAQEIVENELITDMDVYQKGNIVYLAHPAVWYTAEGGIEALDIMLQDLESQLLH
ncbi:MAG TPA: ABC transporter substrate-binding protein [Candidatus Cottocaccamicrobium excrementipullorum]|nr:ABC transporter substrate-binding protein [Candidatus Cottocaccamicrobium excrementipullorum]